MKQFVFALAMAAAVAGCRASFDGDPNLRWRHNSYELSFSDDHRRGGHCPPGHHMKGWC